MVVNVFQTGVVEPLKNKTGQAVAEAFEAFKKILKQGRRPIQLQHPMSDKSVETVGSQNSIFCV